MNEGERELKKNMEFHSLKNEKWKTIVDF